MIEIHPEQLTIEEMKELAKEQISVEVETFRGKNYHTKAKIIPMFVIAKNTLDYPGKYTVRLFDGKHPTCLVAVKNSHKEARKAIPRACSKCAPRSKTDNRVIVETWF